MQVDNNEPYNATLFGLHKWHTHVFERLGWMLLAKAHGKDNQIKCYCDSVDALEAELLLRLKNDTDLAGSHKKDLQILLKNVMVLKQHIKKSLHSDMQSAPAMVAEVAAQNQMGGKRRKSSRKGSKKSSRKGSRKMK